MPERPENIRQGCLKSRLSVAALALWMLLAGSGLAVGQPVPSTGGPPPSDPRPVPDGPGKARRVLLLFGAPRLTPAIEAVDTAIRSTIESRSPVPVTFYTEYLDFTLFGGDEPQPELRALLQRKYATRPIDLIVAIASRPLRVALRNRKDLFSNAPVVFVSVDPKAAADLRLDADVTGTWLHIGWTETLDLARRLQPDIRRAVVIGGVTPADRVWLDQARQQLAMRSGSVEVEYLAGLGLEDVLKAVAALPTRTVVLVGPFLRDVTGRDFVMPEAIGQIAASSSVPTYGVMDSAVGAGAVGGHVVSFEAHGRIAADLALRVLAGERPPPTEASTTVSMVDARQLARWHLDARRLPAGTVVRFREPSLWERHRWAIILVLSVLAGQTLVVAALLFERRRRQRAQAALEDRLRFETLLTEISAGFADPPGGVLREPDRTARPADSVDDLVREGLRRIAQGLGAEGASLWRFSTSGASLTVSWSQQGLSAPPAEVSLDDFPFLRTRVMQGETLRFLSLDELPSEASVDRQSLARYEVRSLVAVPLEVADPDRRTISCLTLRNGRTWPDDVVQRLRTVGEVFAGALARAQAEAALSESEARFRSMADNAPVLIWMSGLDKGCTFFNKGWLDFTGRPMAKELGSGWVEGVHPDDVDRCLDTYVSAFDLRQPFSMEYRLRRHDGQYRTIVDRGVPRFAPDGTLVGYIGCADDITERKRGEELPRQVLEAAPNAMIMANQDGRITLVNAAVETVFGYAREELIGSAIEILVPERVRSHHPGDRTHYFADPRVRMMGAGRELYGRRKDGSAVPVEIGLTPIQTPEGLFVLASVIDITARKAAELDAERHRAELAHVERISTMGQLATSLAHELNQPLTAILANAQTAQEWLSRASPDLAEIRETVDDIITEDIRASEVIRRMRGLIRKGELRSDAVDVNELARDVTRLAANDALLRGASIECDLSPALPTVRGDVVQFQQVLLNLLVNGLHAVAEQPSPRRRVIVRTASRDGGVEVSVQDTGKGIAESDLQQVFAPFYSTKGEGLGVGLSISRSIVETYGGRIWAENNPDGGAIFRVRLPAGSTAAEPPDHSADLPG